MKRTDNDTQIALRVPKSWVARADTLAKKILETGGTRADVLRVAVARGLASLEAERKRS